MSIENFDTSELDKAGLVPADNESVETPQEKSLRMEELASKYDLPQEHPELHDSHVTTKENFDYQQRVEKEEKDNEKRLEQRKRTATEVMSQLQGKDSLGTVQTLVNLYRKNSSEEGAAGWVATSEAIRNIVSKLPENVQSTVLELANDGNHLLRALAVGPIDEVAQLAAIRREKRALIESGIPEHDVQFRAESKVANLVEDRMRDIRAAEKLLEKIGVDTYNIR